MDQPSSTAEGDDNTLSDDEEGVLFPEMIRGDTTIILVKMTVLDVGSGSLNAWLDWNGDGDFADSGEKIAGPVAVFETGTVSLRVTIPANAIITRPTFARFRFGDYKNISETGPSSWGEVEDYEVRIKDKTDLL
jgi:hypothetical protein